MSKRERERELNLRAAIAQMLTLAVVALLSIAILLGFLLYGRNHPTSNPGPKISINNKVSATCTVQAPQPQMPQWPIDNGKG